jgi:hypothetical protein
LSYRHSGYRKLKKILKDYENHDILVADMLTKSQQERLIFWALHIPKGN